MAIPLWQAPTASGGTVAPAAWQAPTVDPLSVTPYGSPAASVTPAHTGVRVNVVSPDGRTFSIDTSELPAVQAQGWKVESSEARGIRQYVEENKGLSGAAKVALRGLFDEATFGVGDVAIDAGTDPYELAKWQALKADHDVANIAGRVGGFGLSLLYGGEFFGAASHAGGAAAKLLGRGAIDAVEHAAGRAVASELAYRGGALATEEAAKVGGGVAKKILQNAADYGAQGLVLSTPKAMAQAITGDPERAAETWLWGGVGGAALGVPIGLAGGVAGKLATRVTTEATASGGGLAGRIAEEHAFRSIASNNASLKKAAKEALTIEGGQRGIGRELLESGLVRNVREDATAYAERLAAAKAEAGEAVGAMYKRLDELGAETGLSAKELAKKMREDVLNPLKGKPGFESVAGKVEAYVESFEEKAASGGWAFGSKDKITFERLHDVRAALDDLVWRSGGANPAEHIKELREIRRMIQRDLVEKGEALAQKHGSEFADPLKKANLRYQRLNAAEKAAADYAEVRELTNRNVSPTDYMAGAAGAIMGGGIGGAAMGAASAYAHKLIREEGNAILARGLDAYSKGRGLVALEEAFANNAKQLDRIPIALETLAAGKKAARAPARETFGVNVLTRFLGAEQKIDTVEDVMAFSDKLASLASDPARAMEAATEATQAIATDAPEVATAASAKLAQAATYLYEKAPKAPGVTSPFEPPSRWRPDAAAVRDFKARLAVAKDPHVAVDALLDGTLTRAHVETLQALAPKLYDEMVKRVADYGASGKAKPLPYAERLRLSMLTGAPLDRSLAQIAGYQQAFASPHAKEQTGGAAGLEAPQMTTDVQRVSSA